MYFLALFGLGVYSELDLMVEVCFNLNGYYTVVNILVVYVLSA